MVLMNVLSKFHHLQDDYFDVFERHSKRARTAGRGPPVIGFKTTPEGHHDMDNKRLLSVAEAKEHNDAVNLNLLQRLVQQEIRTV